MLDDGWFHGRRTERSGLGDWWVDGAVWPRGLGRLADRVRDLGMELGLWVEPEMANPDSEPARRHPDWALAAPGRWPRTARHQVVLNLARPEVSVPLRGDRHARARLRHRLPQVGPQP